MNGPRKTRKRQASIDRTRETVRKTFDKARQIYSGAGLSRDGLLGLCSGIHTTLLAICGTVEEMDVAFEEYEKQREIFLDEMFPKKAA